MAPDTVCPVVQEMVPVAATVHEWSDTPTSKLNLMDITDNLTTVVSCSFQLGPKEQTIK